MSDGSKFESVNNTYAFPATEHRLVRHLFDIVLHGLGLIFVLEAESLVFDQLGFLFLESLS